MSVSGQKRDDGGRTYLYVSNKLLAIVNPNHIPPNDINHRSQTLPSPPLLVIPLISPGSLTSDLCQSSPHGSLSSASFSSLTPALQSLQTSSTPAASTSLLVSLILSWVPPPILSSSSTWFFPQSRHHPAFRLTLPAQGDLHYVSPISSCHSFAFAPNFLPLSCSNHSEPSYSEIYAWGGEFI